MRYRLFLAFLLSFGWAAASLPDSLHVGFVTCYPGSDIYQLEGHSALHIHGRYADQPVDVAINYGLFDFNAPNFVYRFVKGETDYWCGEMPWSHFVAPYMREGRQVVEHPIPLDSVQTQRLLYLVGQNLLPENSVYRYNYVKDNCATRPLRTLELALGDSIILPEPTGICAQDQTFRDIMRTHHAHYPWYQFGIDLALGSGIDYKISAREKSFAPSVLVEQLSGATVGGKPLAGEPVVIVPSLGDPVLPPTPWYLTPCTVAWLLFVITAFISWHDMRHRTVSRWFDTILYTLYGLAGCVIAFLVFVSVHEAASPNWLLLWLNPLCFIVPIFIWLKKCKIVVLSYQFINFALILAMCIAWPFTGQSGNVAFIPLIGCDLLRAASYIITFNKLKTKHIQSTLHKR